MSIRPSRCTAAAVAVLLVFAVVTVAPAQVKVGPSGVELSADQAAEQDPALQAHVEYLIRLIDHQNRIIRRSAHQGLNGVGKAALPRLDALAADADSNRGKIAVRLAAGIRKRMDRAKAAPADAADAKAAKRKKRQPGIAEKAVGDALQAAGADASMAGSIKSIVDEHRRRLRALRKKNSGVDPADVRDQRAQATREYRERLNGVLGAEKTAAFIKALSRQRADRRKPKARADGSDA